MDRGVIETAFISGRLGQAIYRENDSLYTMPLGGAPRHTIPAELQEVCSQGAEFQIVHQRTTEQLEEDLRKSANHYNTLFLVLSVLDQEVSFSTRVVAAQEAEHLLTEEECWDFVSRRLLSIPLPVTTRAHRHQLVSWWTEFQHLKSLLSEVFESQAILDELWATWNKTLDALTIDPAHIPSIEATLISAGLFCDAVRAISSGDHQRFNAVIVKHATQSETSQELASAKALLTSFRAEAHAKFFPSSRRAVQRPLKLKKPGPSRSQRPATSTERISALIDGLAANAGAPRRYVGALEAKARVDKQIAAIREALLAGKDASAESYLEDLIAYQIGQGDREHAAMSLCSLTAIAVEANQLDMADRLSLNAIRLTSDDEVVYTSRAEVLKHRGHFDAALNAYLEAIDRFGQDRWALNGYADVLKEKGLYDESIKRYKENQQSFPDDPVAFNGEISVLKARGEFRSALSLALKHAKRFELDSITRSTLAGCLASLGKYEDALRHYKVAISLDPSNARTHISYAHALRENGDTESALQHVDAFLAKAPKAYAVLNMKATLLRNSGRLDEAETLYTNIIKMYPRYFPAKFGIAAIRVLQGRVDDARVSLPDTGMESELDWFGLRLNALSFARVGDYRRAAPRLASGLGNCPWVKESSKLATALGCVELHRGDLDRSIGLLNRNLDSLEARDQQVRFVFLAHAHAQKGAKDIARILLGRRFASREPNLKMAREALVTEYDLPVPLTRTHNCDREWLRTKELTLAMAA